MSPLLDWLRGLLHGSVSGDIAPEPPSRCFTFIDLGRGGAVIQDRRRHTFKRRGQAASPVCLRCNAPNPYLRAPKLAAVVWGAADGTNGVAQYEDVRGAAGPRPTHHP